MKFTPLSTALLSAPMASLWLACPHEPPIAHAPKLISETFHPARPRLRYLIVVLALSFSVGKLPRVKKLRFYGFSSISMQVRADFRLKLLQASRVAARSGFPVKDSGAGFRLCRVTFPPRNNLNYL